MCVGTDELELGWTGARGSVWDSDVVGWMNN